VKHHRVFLGFLCAQRLWKVQPGRACCPHGKTRRKGDTTPGRFLAARVDTEINVDSDKATFSFQASKLMRKIFVLRMPIKALF